MLVSEKNRADALGLDAAPPEAPHRLLETEAAVEQDPRPAMLDEECIAAASATEAGEPHRLASGGDGKTGVRRTGNGMAVCARSIPAGNYLS